MSVHHDYRIKPTVTPEGHQTYALMDYWCVDGGFLYGSAGTKVLATNPDKSVLERAIAHLTKTEPPK